MVIISSPSLTAVLEAEFQRAYRVGVILWLPQVVVVPVD